MKYQAHIMHINGDIISVIWDDDWERFVEEVELAKKDIIAYLGDSDFEYNSKDLFIEVV